MTVMKYPITLQKSVIVIVATLACCSCGSTKVATQLVRDIHKDTVYLSNTQYDSIYIVKDRFQDRSKDTVYLKDVSIEYRYKMIHDTAKVVQRDSNPYEVTVVQTKEIVRPLTAYDKASRFYFWPVITAVLVFLSKFVFKLKSHFRL